jgi:ABC-2 type transport system ATP-binding protein
MTMITLRGLEMSFGSRRVLRGLYLTVGEGEVYGLLGNNGAGKSTAINILTGLLQADAGEALVAGGPLTPATRTWTGVAPQEIALYPHLTCRENLLFFAGVYHLRGSARRRRVDDVIRIMELGDHASTPVAALSGGWQRRLNLAVAIVHGPRVLILDEPTAGLDIQTRHNLWASIRRFAREGTSVLLTTHMLDEAEILCDRVGILHAGRIVREGTVDGLWQSVPAAELAEVEAEDDEALLARARSLRIPTRRYGGQLTLLLPSPTTLAALVQRLDGVAVRSLRLRPIGLTQVFLEATRPEEVRLEDGVEVG